MTERKLICLTPVKNEAWILRSFLTVVSTWADYIVISDNGSTDGSKEIAKSFHRVIYLDNDEMREFDEYKMRKPLIDAARQIPGKNVLISLDADEAIPNINDDEWKKIINLPEGTLVQMRFLNVTPDFKNYFEGALTDVVYIDDGASFNRGGIIHDTRLKIKPKNTYVSTLGFFHFQFTDWKRMESKHRWYQCYERITFPKKSPIDIYRRYHWMYSPLLVKYPINEDWIRDYVGRGGQTSFQEQQRYLWDEKIYEYFYQYGTKKFEAIDIWSYPWNIEQTIKRSFSARLLLLYLKCTNGYYYSFPKMMHVFDSIIRKSYKFFIKD